jgi:predicted 2-oxoglutarate/Fe(II)-dependent dioxygenase YbiX
VSYHLIPDVLDTAALDAIRDSIADVHFVDGRGTAGR